MILVNKLKNRLKKAIIAIKTKALISVETESLIKFYEQYKDFVYNHHHITYHVVYGQTLESGKHKWVGGVYYNDKFIGIPNDAAGVLIKTDNAYFTLPVPAGMLKWTGGSIYDKYIYAFPRTQSSFLKVDLCNNSIDVIQINQLYTHEHHYGGICTEYGIVYQPPRNCDHILKTDLKTGKSKAIFLTPRFLNLKFRYCGSILHPNGFIYFFPEERGKIIKLNPVNDKWVFIDKMINIPTYDVKVAFSGIIYGFSHYGKGILKLDVHTDKVSILYPECNFGAFGTKLGLNGKMYSVPGDGRYIWEFNPETEICKTVCELDERNDAKYAGGTTSPDGAIYFTPTNSRQELKLIPLNDYDIIPENIYSAVFTDCY